MLKLLKYEGYKIIVEPELLSLKPFRMIWNRDKSKNKERAILEISFVYFMEDPRSDYQYITDSSSRAEAIKEAEGLPSDWKPDKLVKEAMEFYSSFKPASALLLEDTRFVADRFRKKLREVVESYELGIKELKEMGALLKQLPSIVKDLDEAEKALVSEIRAQGKMRGQGEKTIFEDGLNL